MKLFAAVFIPLALIGCSKSSRAPEALSGFKIPQLAALKFEQTQATRSVKEHTVETFTAQDGESEVLVTRIENLDAAHAAQMLEQKKFQVESLYREEKSPYPGFFSKAVKCPKEFLPEIDLKMGEKIRVRAAANGRKSLGVCEIGEMKFIAIQLLLYCPAVKAMLQIESYLPKSETAKAAEYLRQVSC